MLAGVAAAQQHRVDSGLPVSDDHRRLPGVGGTVALTADPERGVYAAALWAGTRHGCLLLADSPADRTGQPATAQHDVAAGDCTAERASALAGNDIAEWSLTRAAASAQPRSDTRVRPLPTGPDGPYGAAAAIMFAQRHYYDRNHVFADRIAALGLPASSTVDADTAADGHAYGVAVWAEAQRRCLLLREDLWSFWAGPSTAYAEHAPDCTARSALSDVAPGRRAWAVPGLPDPSAHQPR